MITAQHVVSINEEEIERALATSQHSESRRVIEILGKAE